jgi:hypothetical protein
MKRFFQIIKKKKHKRQFGALWLFLIVLELFCPVLCDEPAFTAAKKNSPTSSVQILSETNHTDGSKLTSVSDYGEADEHPLCNDECLCHATAVPNASIASLKELSFSGERIVFSTPGFYTNSLSPPHQPPKIS